MTQSELRIFISYSDTETTLADAMCAFLETRGLPCWIAPRDMEVGNPYSQTIIEKIESSYAMILILSRTSNESDYIFSEVGNAFHRKIPILEFRIHPVQLHKRLEFYLNMWHRLDATTGRPEDHFPKLYEHCIARRAAPNPQRPEMSVHPQPAVRRIVVLFAGGLVLATMLYFAIHHPAGDKPVRAASTDTQSHRKDSPAITNIRPVDSVSHVTHRRAPAPSIKFALDGAVFIQGPSPELSDTKEMISFFGVKDNTTCFSLNIGIYTINGKMRLTGNRLEIIKAEPACTGEMSLIDDGATLTGFFQPSSSDRGTRVRLTRQQP